ncbi:MAG: LON peptidase substrate-binding domain-containing protein [Ornithinimicrobium sp.]
MAVLPLFPLGTALMPGSFLPLQIFEDRYVALLEDLVREQETRPPVFGVVAIRKGYEVGEAGARALHTVGCSAQLRQATSLGEDRFLIVIEGRTRFRIEALQSDEQTPYAQAEITWLEEVSGDDRQIPSLARALRGEVATYRATLGDDALESPDDDRVLSYWLPEALDLDLSDRQLLLASESTETRLRLSRHMVRRESTLNSSLGTTNHTGRSFGGPMSPN